MAILIRKNNSAEITAYLDAVIFHYSKGMNGIYSDAGLGMSASITNNKVIINPGQGVLYGRQFEIPSGQTEVIDLSQFQNSNFKFFTVFVEVDLRDSINETIEFGYEADASSYPDIDPGDNLITIKQGVARLPMFHVYRENNGGGSVERIATRIRPNIFPVAEESFESDNTKKINGITIKYDPPSKNLLANADQMLERVIEGKRILYDNQSGILITKEDYAKIIKLQSNVQENRFLDFEFDCIITTAKGTQTQRHYESSRIQKRSGATHYYLNFTSVDVGYGNPRPFYMISLFFSSYTHSPGEVFCEIYSGINIYPDQTNQVVVKLPPNPSDILLDNITKNGINISIRLYRIYERS